MVCRIILCMIFLRHGNWGNVNTIGPITFNNKVLRNKSKKGEKMKEYRTTDLYEAAYLSCRGYNYESIEQHGDMLALVYNNSQDLTQALKEYHGNEKFAIKTFAIWHRGIKADIFRNSR